MRNKTTNMELAEILWDNYYVLDANPLQAMANLWNDYAHGTLREWAKESFSISDKDLLHVVTVLTKDLRRMDLSKTAYEHATDRRSK